MSFWRRKKKRKKATEDDGKEIYDCKTSGAEGREKKQMEREEWIYSWSPEGRDLWSFCLRKTSLWLTIEAGMNESSTSRDVMEPSQQQCVYSWKPALIGQTKVLQSLGSISVRTNIRTSLRCHRGIVSSTVSGLHAAPKPTNEGVRLTEPKQFTMFTSKVKRHLRCL